MLENNSCNALCIISSRKKKKIGFVDMRKQVVLSGSMCIIPLYCGIRWHECLKFHIILCILHNLACPELLREYVIRPLEV